MHYVKIYNPDTEEELWLGPNPTERANPLPLDETELVWAVLHYIRRYKKEGWMLTVSTGSC